MQASVMPQPFPRNFQAKIAQRCSLETDVLTAPIRYNGSFHGNPGGPTPLNKSAWLLAGLLLTGIATIPACRNQSHWHGEHKMIILGIDGMDPQLLTKFMAKARCRTSPNWRRRALSPADDQHSATKSGGVVESDHRNECRRTRDLRLHPPRPEDAGAVFFDLEGRKGPKHAIHLGKWVIPLGGGSAEQSRQGAAFWQILDDTESPTQSSAFRQISLRSLPRARRCPAWERPTCAGTYGTFTFYTDDPPPPWRGRRRQVVPVQVEKSRVTPI